MNMLKTLKVVEFIKRNRKYRIINKLNKRMASTTTCSNADDAYEEAVKALNSLQSTAAVLQQAKKNVGKLNTNVAETRKFLIRSGVSQETLDTCLSIIHVAGTKGKGSTCAFTESILRQRGFRTGFYSSPHLVAVRERIRINGKPLSKEMFTRYFWDVYDKLIALKENDYDMPPYFKFLTVMAFNVFLKERVDVAVIEVGLGGEYDCTNVIRCPVVVGITSLGLDHTSILGNTVELIAGQKAGIMKFGTPAYTVDNQPGQSLSVLRGKATEIGCSLTVSPPLSDYIWPGSEPGPVLGLDSKVQQLNASLAIQLSYAWLRHHETGITDGSTILEVDSPTSRGLRLARWSGRAQTLPHSPNICFFLDGAHTIESIEHCLNWFIEASENQPQLNRQIKKVLIFNSTGEREPVTLLRPLCNSGVFQYVAFCPNLATSKNTSDQSNFMVTREQQLERVALHAEAWAQLQCPQLGSPEVPSQVFNSFGDVLDWLQTLQDTKHTLHILITGSLHLVGCALGLLEPSENQVVTPDEQYHLHISALPLVGTVH